MSSGERAPLCGYIIKPSFSIVNHHIFYQLFIFYTLLYNCIPGYLLHQSTSFYFQGETSKWWNSLNEDTIFYSTWEKFENLFLNKWIKDTKIKEMHKIQVELKDQNKNISNFIRVLNS
jgi:hypothetical protein